MAHFIFVTGGVVSGLGKGISAAAIGQLLKRHGYRVMMQKFDPYINVDPGTMSPYQHGEVFVTHDGAETDLDLGHYERFIDEHLTRDSSVTAGQIYEQVIKDERQGKYLGHTVQVIPHITDAIKRKLEDIQKSTNADIVITEIGGTVGDIESLPFIEAIRQFRRDMGYHNTFYMHTTLIPFIKASGEYKTKPTQYSLKELRSLGIQADGVILRSDAPIEDEILEKVALFGDVDQDKVFKAHDVDILYEVILSFAKQNITHTILNHFKMPITTLDLTPWETLIDKMKAPKDQVKIAMVGKYVELPDAYISINEALSHAGYDQQLDVDIVMVDAEKYEDPLFMKTIQSCHGVLIPGGFGVRATEGKIKAIEYARTHQVPFLGICFGMQLAVVEYARHVLKLEGAHSTELDPHTKHPVIDIQRGRSSDEAIGGTLRLGASKSYIQDNTKLFDIYQSSVIDERHRHRYEVNPKYHETLQDGNLLFSAWDETNTLVEAIELKAHPFFVGVQYHPEFLSRPLKPHPLYQSFVNASYVHKQP
jgi:CTP synthase